MAGFAALFCLTLTVVSTNCLKSREWHYNIDQLEQLGKDCHNNGFLEDTIPLSLVEEKNETLRWQNVVHHQFKRQQCIESMLYSIFVTDKQDELRQAHRACRNAITQLLFADNSLRLGQLDKVDSHMSSVSDKLRIAVLTIKYLDSLDKAVNGTDNDNGYGISPWWLLPYLLLILLFAAYRSDQFNECMKCCGQCMVKDILTSPRDLRRLGHFTYRELLASRPIRVAKIRAEAEKAKKELSLP